MFPRIYFQPFSVSVQKPEPQGETSVTETAEFERLREQYATFACGSHQSKAQAREEFIALCALPGVQVVAFEEEEKVLYVGTEHIYLRKYEWELWRDIGEFIIEITRSPAKILFKNNDRQVGEQKYHHPHINDRGVICMSDGKGELMDAIAEGNLVLAVRISLVALNTVGTYPYGAAALEHWPLKET